MIGFSLFLLSLIMIVITAAQTIRPTDYKVFHPGTDGKWIMRTLKTDNNGLIHINTAESEELTELPGIGDSISNRIIAERDENGPFYYAEDLIAVKGIGSVIINNIREMIDLSVDESEE